jgi:transcriptional regulator with XRE-family HTH domain
MGESGEVREREVIDALADVVRDAMHAHGLTEQSVAEGSGLSPELVRAIARGEARPSLSAVLSLADGLGITVGQLGEQLERRLRPRRPSCSPPSPAREEMPSDSQQGRTDDDA